MYKQLERDVPPNDMRKEPFMGFYIENFALRLLFGIVTCVAATNLGMFVRASLITHEAFVFDPVKGLAFPLLLGVLMAVMWKPKAR